MEKRIMQAALEQLNLKGLEFTMSDLATALQMSKKTLYKMFGSKENLIKALVDDAFTQLRLEKEAFMNSDDTPDQQLSAVLKHHPDFLIIVHQKLSTLQYTYPEFHKQIVWHINSEWEMTLALLDTCIQQRLIRSVDPEIFKMTLSALYEKHLNDEPHLSLEQLNSCIDFILEGVRL